MRPDAVKLERVRMTKVGLWYVLITVVTGVAATNTGNNALYLVASVLLGLLAISGLASKRNLSRIALEFGRVPEVHAGQAFSIPMRVANRDPIFGRRYVVLGGVEEVEPQLLAFLPCSESEQRTLGFVIKGRGLHEFSHLRISSVFPLGLFEKAMRYPVGLEVLVYPKILPASGMRHFDPARVGEEPSRRAGWSHELRTLRRFEHGDDPRGIHWKRSARQGELVFMEREAEQGLRLSILFDNAVGPLRDDAELERFEHMVSEAASAAVHYLAEGYEVSLTTRDETIPHGGGRLQRQRMLTALALIRPAPRAVQPLRNGRRGAAELRLGWDGGLRAS